MENNSIINEAKNVLMQLFDNINILEYDQYNCQIPLLGNATIGQHSRHIIELFQQLTNHYDSGMVDYDKRIRDPKIETDINYASECIALIISQLIKPDKKILVTSVYNEQQSHIQSSYFRELLYNIEHCIHHQAILKIGFRALEIELADPTFGYAKSTLIYQEKAEQASH